MHRTGVHTLRRYSAKMRRLSFLLIRRGVAAAAGLSALAAGSATLAEAAEQKQQQRTRQWLWTIDGIQLQRDAETGETVYIDESTGEVRTTRPVSVPPEAYENRWRRLHAWDVEPDAHGKQGRAAKHLLLVRHAQYDTNGSNDSLRVLTPLGYQQTEYLGARLRAIHDASEGNFKVRA